MAELVEPNERRLREILRDETRYMVPPYQREYSWTDEHVGEFLDDLFHHKSLPDPPDYFFGVLYTQKIERYKKIIIDGQQRLTTVVTLLSVIRDMLNHLKTPELSKSVGEYLYSSYDHSPRLTLSIKNDEFFQDNILKPGDPESKIKKMRTNTHPSNEKLTDAYCQIYKKLSDASAQPDIDRADYLFGVQMHLVGTFIVVENALGSNDETVNEIFETVNRRGVDLTDSDYIKNRIISMAHAKNVDLAKLNDKWLELLDIIRGSARESVFLRHYLIAHRETTSAGKVLPEKKVAGRIFEIIKEYDNPIAFVDHLIEVAITYRSLREPGTTGDFNDNLRALKQLDSKAVYPALLIGRHVFEDRPDRLKKLSRYILNYFFRARTIGSAEAGSVEKTIADVCQILRKGGTVEDVRKHLSESHSNPEDSVFETQFRVYAAKAKTALYILSELNRHLSGGNDLTGSTTLEHIMPNAFEGTPWEAQIAKDLNTHNASEIKLQHARFLNRLGNLTLLSAKRNSRAKNLPFKEKQNTVYKNDNVKITSDLSAYDTWNTKIISDRQEIFSKLAVKIWHL